VRRDLAGLAIALAAVGLAASPALGNEFVWDDVYVIEHGTVIHDWSNLPDVVANRTLFASSRNASLSRAPSVDTWRPVTVVTFMWDSTLSGRDPWAYHLTNLVAHLACVVLVFFVARRLLPVERRSYAVFGAAWFGLTPLLGEAHLWINGRSDLFCTLFGLGALLAYSHALAAERPGRRATLHVLAAGLFLLGLLSKEVLLLALPAFLLLPDREGSASFGARLRRLVPLVAVSVAYLAARVVVLSGLRAGGGPQLAAAAVRLPVLLLDGLLHALVPASVYVRSLDDDYRALGLTIVLALGAVAILAGVLVVRARRRAPLVAWSLLFYACTLAPAAVIATMLWPGFGRYLYLPCAALAVGLSDVAGRLHAWALAERPALARIAALSAIAYLGLLGARLHLWAYDFRDEDALYESVIVAAPERAHGWGWLGMTRIEQGRPAEAVPLLERADRLAPHRPRYLRALAEARLAAGDVQGALDAAATGIARYDDEAPFHWVAARALAHARPDLAAHHVRECLRADPSHAGCRERSDPAE
jgi:tetratricopeptide (TPR) repeat protein